jgi:hypothetical protein
LGSQQHWFVGRDGVVLAVLLLSGEALPALAWLGMGLAAAGSPGASRRWDAGDFQETL